MPPIFIQGVRPKRFFMKKNSGLSTYGMCTMRGGVEEEFVMEQTLGDNSPRHPTLLI